MSVFEALKLGNIQPFSNKRLIGLLWIINLITAFLLGIPIYIVFNRYTGYSLMGEKLKSGLELAFLFELLQKNSSLFVAIIICLFIVCILYIFTGIFVNGSAISIMHHKEKKFLFRNFFRHGGNYFGRFLRLFIISLFSYIIICYLIIHRWIFSPLIGRLTISAPSDTLLIKLIIIEIAAIIAAAGLITMIFDYAKVGTIVEDRRSMILNFFRSVGFVLRYMHKTLFLYVFVTVEAIVLIILYFILSSQIQLLQHILFMFLFQQLFILSKFWIKLNYFGGEISLFKSLRVIKKEGNSIPL